MVPVHSILEFLRSNSLLVSSWNVQGFHSLNKISLDLIPALPEFP